MKKTINFFLVVCLFSFVSCKQKSFSYYLEESPGRDRLMFSSVPGEGGECVTTFFSAIWVNGQEKFLLAKKQGGDFFGVWDVELGDWFIEPKFSSSWTDSRANLETENGTLWFLPIDKKEEELPEVHVFWFGSDDQAFEIPLPKNPFGSDLFDEFENYGSYDPELNLFILGRSGYVLYPTNFQWDHFDQLIKLGGPNVFVRIGGDIKAINFLNTNEWVFKKIAGSDISTIESGSFEGCSGVWVTCENKERYHYYSWRIISELE